MRCTQPRLASRPWLVTMPWEAVPGFRGDHSGPSVLRGTLKTAASRDPPRAYFKWFRTGLRSQMILESNLGEDP